MRFGFLLLTMLLAFTLRLFGLEVETSLMPQSARIGDVLKFKIDIHGLNDAQKVKFPPSPTDEFELLQIDSSIIQTKSSIIFQLAVFDTGIFTIPSLPVVISNGAAIESLKTETVSVRINSFLPDTASEVRSLKPFRSHPFQWRELKVWIFGVAAIILALVGWYFWKKYRRKKDFAEVPIELLLPAHELAYRELILLKDKKYPTRGMLKEYYSEFSEILRRYVERRYSFPALEMTTYDLESEFESPHFSQDLRTKLLPALREADLVKFAKFLPAFDECDKLLELGFSIVSATKEETVLITDKDKVA